jgi:hypothetical protein
VGNQDGRRVRRIGLAFRRREATILGTLW